MDKSVSYGEGYLPIKKEQHEAAPFHDTLFNAILVAEADRHEFRHRSSYFCFCQNPRIYRYLSCCAWEVKLRYILTRFIDSSL